MKKTFITLAILGLLVAAPSAFADVERVSGVWDVTTGFVIEFTCTSGCSGTYPHTMTIDVMDEDTGEFSGNGYYNPNPDYTWDVVGTTTDSGIELDITYTNINAGYTVDAEGTIAEDGTMSGTATSSTNQTFDWQTASGTATRFEGNHGEYVSSQETKEEKQEAAQSRIGMPVQSQGHTEHPVQEQGAVETQANNEDNHGQHVRSQGTKEEKKAAAKSNVGMPEKSKGPKS